MNWYKKSQLGPYSVLEKIEMQGDAGLPIKTMYFFDLKEAKELEKAGLIRRVVKHDDGKYTVYVINKEHVPDFEESKKYMRDLSP